MATPKTNECPSPDQLRGLLSGALSARDQEALARHIEACPSCQHTLDGWLSSPSIEGLAASAGADTATQEAALRDLMDVVKKKSVGDATQAEPAETNDGNLSYLEPSEKPGTLGRLKNYEIREILGKGGFGTVFKALDTKLQRMVAIKVLAPEFAANGSARKRFVREAQAAAAVKNEHVVAIYNVEDEHQPPYIVMEIIDGISLQDRLDKSGSLELKEILRIGMQIAEGLAAAHKQGLIHRDIKPANVLLENGVQRVKITDFGLARLGDDASITQSGVIAGTPMYMAPEQAIGEKLDQRADLFSLGSLLYALCTGRGPFRAANTMAVLKRVCDETPRPIREINPEIPDWLEGIIAKLHAKKPDERYQTAREVADVFSEKLAELQFSGRANGGRAEGPKAPVETSTTAAPATGSSRSRGLVIAGVLLALTASIIAAAVIYWPRAGENVVVAPPTQAQATGDPGLNDAVLVMNFERDTFYEKDGKTYVRDLSGQGNDGLCEKVAFTSDGQAGGALRCDGGFLRLPKHMLNQAPDYTIAAWVYSEQDEEQGFKLVDDIVFDEIKGQALWGVHLNSERVYVNAWNNSFQPENWKGFHAPLAVKGRGWQFVAVRLRNGGVNRGELEVTRNGQTVKGTLQMLDSDGDAGNLLLALNSKGKVDELVILKRAVSDTEIAAIRSRGLKGIPLGSDNLPPATATPPRAIAPFDAAKAKAHQETWARYLGVEPEITNSIGMKFVWIPPGTFMMGSPKEELGREPTVQWAGYETQHKVSLTKGFYMGVYTVTQEQYETVMGNNPSNFKGEKNLPVEMVNWYDCQAFIKKLREVDKKQYRLPTEAEWEYACRAGTITPFHFGDTISSDQTNYNGEAYANGKKGVNRGKTTPIGKFPANRFGLYDMHGNVFQWCQDRYEEALPQKDVVDPQGPNTGQMRVLRGGSWYGSPEHCRSATRFWSDSGVRGFHMGFRLVLPAPATGDSLLKDARQSHQNRGLIVRVGG